MFCCPGSLGRETHLPPGASFHFYLFSALEPLAILGTKLHLAMCEALDTPYTFSNLQILVFIGSALPFSRAELEGVLRGVCCRGHGITGSEQKFPTGFASPTDEW